MGKFFTRMGDNSAIWLSELEIRNEIESGMREAADRGKIPELSEDDLQKLFDIIVHPHKVVSVERGNEVIHTFDGGAKKFPIRCGVPVDRFATVIAQERAFCSDAMELDHIDYSFKPVKPIVHTERQMMEMIQLAATIPVLYGAMPNLGLYTKPDGPVDNWSELLPLGKVKEAKEAQLEAVELAVKDMVYVSSEMYDAGADGIDFDTVGASGDADFLATLKAIEILRKKFPDLEIEVGMSGEFVLGMHGELEYGGERLAGMYPHKQVKAVEQAGGTVFGAVIITNTKKTFPWNLARVVTFVKACTDIAKIPVHANAGMGVGAVPLTDIAAVDAVTRVSKALVEIGKADGL